MEDEESILVSSDSWPSEPDKPPLFDDSDFDFLPKTKLSDILVTGPTKASREGIPGPSWRVDPLNECYEALEPSSKAMKRFEDDNPRVSAIIHELSDSEDSKELVTRSAWYDSIKSHSPEPLPTSPPKDECSPIQLRDRESSKSPKSEEDKGKKELHNGLGMGEQDPPNFAENVHTLSDGDADTVPAESPPRRPQSMSSVEMLTSPGREQSESSQSTLSPPIYFEDVEKCPTRFKELIGLPKTAEPKRLLPKLVHELSDSDSDSLPNTDSCASACTLPLSELDSQAHSEPILNTTSYEISELVSQTGNSQPLGDFSRTTNRKQGRHNSVDILERRRLRELKLKEKKKAAELAERIRRMRPKECMKYITVELHEDMASEYSWVSATLPILASLGVKCKLAPSVDPCTVKWTRDQPESPIPLEEKHVLFLWSADRLVTSVKSGTLVDTFTCLKCKFGGYKVYLGIYGLYDYYKRASRSEKQRKNHDGGKPGVGNSRTSKYEVTESQIRIELCRLLMVTGISHKVLSSPEEAAEYLQALTQSVAELPFKLEREKLDTERDWFAKGDSKNCVRVDSSGNGFSQLWLQQLAQFNNSTLDTAKAIAELYPSPLSLYSAYKQCSTRTEQEKMLQNVLVRKGPSGAGRRLGPELSRRISIMFVQDGGDVSLS